MISRRRLLFAGGLGAVRPVWAWAQTRAVRVGMLAPRSLENSYYARSVLSGLAELGYRQGSGLLLEYRSADGAAERFPTLARELIERGCNVIIALGPEAPARALRESPVPAVFVAVDYDPVEKGIVSSLRRPGGNLTGVYVQQYAMVAKRMDLMREVLPRASRFLVFADVFSKDQVPAIRKAAAAANVEITLIDFAKPPYDYPAAFEAGRKAAVQGFVGLASPVFADDSHRLAKLLLQYGLPAAASSIELADAGFLLSFGADSLKVARRAAEMAVRILAGGKPADMPVQQADEFELAVNLRTAEALSLKLPFAVMARATKLIY